MKKMLYCLCLSLGLSMASAHCHAFQGAPEGSAPGGMSSEAGMRDDHRPPPPPDGMHRPPPPPDGFGRGKGAPPDAQGKPIPGEFNEKEKSRF